MIFVTVGTHEQPFNRVVEEIDQLVKRNIIKEEVFIQTGYSTYEPQYCEWEKLIPYEEMQEKIKEARIVITHGGPSSFLNVLQYNKKPIVIPRREKYNEHVNDHQIEFLDKVIEKGYNILKVENEKDLKMTIENYSNESSKFSSHNSKFNELFSKIVYELVN